MKINEILTEGLDPKSWYGYLTKLMPDFGRAYQQVAQQKDKLKSVVNSLSSRDQTVTKDTVKAAVARAFPTADLHGTVIDRLASAVAAEAQTPALTEVVGMFGVFLIMLIAYAIGRDSRGGANDTLSCERCGHENARTANYCKTCGLDFDDPYSPPTHGPSVDVYTSPSITKPSIQKSKPRSQAEYNAELNRRTEALRKQGKSEAEIDRIIYGD